MKRSKRAFIACAYKSDMFNCTIFYKNVLWLYDDYCYFHFSTISILSLYRLHTSLYESMYVCVYLMEVSAFDLENINIFYYNDIVILYIFYHWLGGDIWYFITFINWAGCPGYMSTRHRNCVNHILRLLVLLTSCLSVNIRFQYSNNVQKIRKIQIIFLQPTYFVSYLNVK